MDHKDPVEQSLELIDALVAQTVGTRREHQVRQGAVLIVRSEIERLRQALAEASAEASTEASAEASAAEATSHDAAAGKAAGKAAVTTRTEGGDAR